MSQTDMNGANAQGAVYRADMNTHLDALVTNNSGGSAPSITFPNMWWFDSAFDRLYQRNNANTVWLPLWRRTDSGWQLLLTKGPDIASSAALGPAVGGNYFDVTGTTTITSISSINIGTTLKFHFDDILILTHNATSLVLPSAADITTQAGDEAEFIEYATGNWRCVNYQRADGTALVGAGGPTATGWTLIDRQVVSGVSEITFIDFVDTSKYDYYALLIDRWGHSAISDELMMQFSWNSGGMFQNTNYRYHVDNNGIELIESAAVAPITTGNTGISGIQLSPNGFSGRARGTIFLYGFGDELLSRVPHITGTLSNNESSNLSENRWNVSGARLLNEQDRSYDSIRLSTHPGGPTHSGRFSLFGISNGG